MTADEPVDLPALDGLDPLGFLASLGVLRLLEHRGHEAKLSFDPTTARARITGVESIDEIVGHLVEAVENLPVDSLMVGLPVDLPPRKQGSKGSDPGRLTASAFGTIASSEIDESARSWLRALWTDLALDEGLCEFTPFSAPSGQQTLRSMFEKPSQIVQRSPRARLDEALRAWRRFDGVTGENLDRRAIREAAEEPRGKATTMGVPGATWLALTAIPLFPMGGDGVDPRALRWRGRRKSPGWTWLSFSWPVWRVPVDLSAATALLAHPAVDAAADLVAAGSESGDRVRRQLVALGVERVVVARRRQRPGGKSSGVLVPAGSWS